MTVRVRVLVREVPGTYDGEGEGPAEGDVLPMTVRVRVLVREVPYL
jgi:hypothetical protein